MTEAEWLATDDVDLLIQQVIVICFPEAEPCNWGGGERKKQLFLLACAERIYHQLPEQYLAVFQLLDPDEEREIESAVRQRTWDAAERLRWAADGHLLFALGYDDIGMFCRAAANVAAIGHPNIHESLIASELRTQASLFRDIFGNPFRPVAFDPAWRTATVTSLAQAIYADRRFGDLPILADALEDAGCTSADVLEHCRTPGEHVRGCWVVDLALGKE